MHNLSSWRTEKFFAAVPKGLIRFLPLSPLWDFTQYIHSTSSSRAENQQLYNNFFKCWWGVAMDVCQRTEFGSKNYTTPCPGPLTDCTKRSVVFLSSWLAEIRWTKYLNPARCILRAWDIDQTDNIWQPYNSDAFQRTATTEKTSEGRQAQCTKFLRSQDRTWQPEEPLSGIIWLTFLHIPLRNPICAYQCF